ncbi:MAG TPA: CoA transferase [Myxococcota bacterium]|nr:CoA transferase [Myxococcota bacterium]
MRPQTVISVEQALTMTYATLRMVHQGWRVIRVEPTPVPGRKSRGDPNRYVGRPVAGEDRYSYFVAPNVGKEAMAVDLKNPAGHKLLGRLISELGADVFCTNTLPARHQKLGIDYASIKRAKEDIVWCCVSAMGLSHPDVPGYDPVLQALCGYMDLTGLPDGPPLQCGPPLADLKAGDEAFIQVLLALIERQETGRGKRIDISMARAAVSWLQTFLPMLDMDSPPAELRRSGNEHRQFIPVNAYRTSDGYVYLAIGSDVQWTRFVDQKMFATLDQELYRTNEGRRRGKRELHAAMAKIIGGSPTRELDAVLTAAGIPHAPITPIEEVPELPFVRENALGTVAPDGRRVRLPPAAADTDHLEAAGGLLPFAPAYGADTDSLLAEIGYSLSEIASLREQRIVA